MYIPINWLKDFVTIKQTPEKVAEVLTLGGFEVEKIEHKGEGLSGVVVGQIKTIVSHAEADKLVVCKVTIGKKELLTIVCGARNIKAGDKVPVAVVGTVLLNGLKIERRRIRGVDSEGMLCAEDELGLGDDHAGILILPAAAKIGQKLAVALKMNEAVLDVTVSPNRADCFSVVGLANEYAALTNQKFNDKKITVPENNKHQTAKILSVQIKDQVLCPKYTARVVKGVTVGPSPQWLQSRLRLGGITPINNIVDSTNYVMLERGQPLHAFDLQAVDGGKIVVRKAGKDKTFITLDGKERQLSPSMLMIADAKKPIAIAGVMGGQNSEIKKSTTDVVIESALFKPLSIRTTRQKLGLVTEASNRFEKGLWWDLPEWAVDRAAKLMAEIAGGTVAAGRVERSRKKPSQPTIITVRFDYIRNLIGRSISPAAISDYVTKLHCSITKKDKETITIVIPSWRQDLKSPADIVEEVGRLYGWNKIKPAPITAPLRPVSLPPAVYWLRKIKQALVGCGMTEVSNYSFYGRDLMRQFSLQEKKHYQIENPLNPEQKYLRTSLIPRLFENIVKSYQSHEQLALFESGTVFNKSTKQLPKEQSMIAGIFYNKRQHKAVDQTLGQAKAVLYLMMKRLGINDWQIVSSDRSIRVNSKTIGTYGWVTTVTAQKLPQLPAWFEIDLARLAAVIPDKPAYKPISPYPAIERDMTFIADAQTNYYELQTAIQKIHPLITEVVGIGIPYQESGNRYSITFRLVYRSPDRTLQAKEAEMIEREVAADLLKQFNLKIKK